MGWKVKKRPVAKLRGAGTDFIGSMAACARVMAEETDGFILAVPDGGDARCTSTGQRPS